MSWRNLLDLGKSDKEFNNTMKSLQKKIDAISRNFDRLDFTEEKERFEQNTQKTISAIKEFHSLNKKDDNDSHHMEQMLLEKVLKHLVSLDDILNQARNIEEYNDIFKEPIDKVIQLNVDFLNNAHKDYSKLISDKKSMANSPIKSGGNEFILVRDKFLEQVNSVKEILENNGFKDQAELVNKAATDMINTMSGRENQNKKNESARGLCYLTSLLMLQVIPSLKEMDSSKDNNILASATTTAVCDFFKKYTPKKQFSIEV